MSLILAVRNEATDLMFGLAWASLPSLYRLKTVTLVSRLLKRLQFA